MHANVQDTLILPAPLCWEERDSSLLADLKVTLSTRQPKARQTTNIVKVIALS